MLVEFRLRSLLVPNSSQISTTCKIYSWKRLSRYDASQPTEKTKLIPNDNEEETFHVISDTQYVIKSDEAAGSQDEDKPGNSKGESDKDSKVKRCCGEIKSWSIIGLLR